MEFPPLCSRPLQRYLHIQMRLGVSHLTFAPQPVLLKLLHQNQQQHREAIFSLVLPWPPTFLAWPPTAKEIQPCHRSWLFFRISELVTPGHCLQLSNRQHLRTPEYFWIFCVLMFFFDGQLPSDEKRLLAPAAPGQWVLEASHSQNQQRSFFPTDSS